MYNFYNPLELTEEQKLVYIRLLIYLTKSDSDVDVMEKQFIKNMILRFQLPLTTLQNLSYPHSIDDLYDILMPMHNRKIAIDLLHCLRFSAAIDHDINENEIKILNNIARILEIDDDTMLVINNFVFDELMFLKQACIALEADEVRC